MASKERKEKRLASYIELVKKAEDFRDSTHKDNWERYYKLWRNYVDDRGGMLDSNVQSNMSIPYVFSQVETIVPRIINAMFPSRPYVAVHPRVPMVGDSAKQHEILLDYQMNEVQYFPKVFQDIVRSAAIFGYGVAYTGWQRQRKIYVTDREEPLMDELTGFPVFEEDGTPVMVTEEEEYEDTFLDDPVVKSIDPALFFFDPNASNLDDARFCGHITYVSEDYLKKMQKLGSYEIDWKETDPAQGKNTVLDDRLGSVGKSSTPTGVMQGENDMHELIHYWEDDRYAVILDRKQLVMEIANPYRHKRKPYDIAPYTKVPFEIGGIGVVEMLEDLEAELNAERNMRMEYRKYIVRPMFAVRKTAGLTPRDMKSYPGKVFLLEEVDDLRQLNLTDVDSSTFAQENIIKQDMKDATGAHDVIMGLHTPGEESATTTITKDNNAGARFKLIIDNMNEVLESIARKMLSMNQQFINDARYVREFNAGDTRFSVITPESLRGEFTMMVMSSTEPMGNAEAYRQRILQLYSILNADPLFNSNLIKKRNFLKKIAESFGLKDTEDILPTDEEIQAAQQPPEMEDPMAALMGGMQGGAPPMDALQSPVPDMGDVASEGEMNVI